MKKYLFLLFVGVFTLSSAAIARAHDGEDDGHDEVEVKAEDDSHNPLLQLKTEIEAEFGNEFEFEIEAESEMEKSADDGDGSNSGSGSDDNADSTDIRREDRREDRRSDDADGAVRLRIDAVRSGTRVEVRGWNPEGREAIVDAVRVFSADDLRSLIAERLSRNERIRRVRIADDVVEVRYGVSARFLGIFPTTVPIVATADQEARIKVHFPWYRFFFNVSEVDVGGIEAVLTNEIETISVGAETDIQIKAKFFQAMSDVMQAELGADASAVTGQ